jgi:hypothetical protein
MSDRIGPVSFTPLSMPAILYAGTNEPIVSGICTGVDVRAYISSSVSGVSLVPKSTVLSVNCLTPPPLPIDS